MGTLCDEMDSEIVLLLSAFVLIIDCGTTIIISLLSYPSDM